MGSWWPVRGLHLTPVAPHVSTGLGTILFGVSGNCDDSEVTSLPEEFPREPDSEKDTCQRWKNDKCLACISNMCDVDVDMSVAGEWELKMQTWPCICLWRHHRIEWLHMGPHKYWETVGVTAFCVTNLWLFWQITMRYVLKTNQIIPYYPHIIFLSFYECRFVWIWLKSPYQLLESRLIQVGLQGEVAEGFPRRLVRLNLHRIPLHCVVVPNRTACHQRCACQALQVLQKHSETQCVKMLPNERRKSLNCTIPINWTEVHLYSFLKWWLQALAHKKLFSFFPAMCNINFYMSLCNRASF